MKQKMVIFLYVVLSTIFGVGMAQVLVEPEGRVPLLKMQTAAMAVPPGTAATTMDLVIDEHPNGGGVTDVRLTDPGVVVSLIQPSGVEVTAANAASLGYSLTGGSARHEGSQCRVA